MRRTNSLLRFAAANRRLLLMLLLLMVGCACGAAIYAFWKAEFSDSIVPLLTVQTVEGDWGNVFSQFFSSCFQTFCLLMVLFLSGLSACGAPVPFAVSFFFGIGVGLTQAYYYAQGGDGVWLCAVLVLPHSLLKAATLLIACVQSLRLSLQIARQLLPKGAHCGGLWQDFQIYCVRFLLLLPLLFAAGALDVAMRAFLLRFFSVA